MYKSDLPLQIEVTKAFIIGSCIKCICCLPGEAQELNSIIRKFMLGRAIGQNFECQANTLNNEVS